MRLVIAAAVALLTSCAQGGAGGCADVVAAAAVAVGEGVRFDVTVASADEGWEKYADLWEVRALDGTVLGERVLAHPHVDEQPFTRSAVIEVPGDVDRVEVLARDSVEGFCGSSWVVDLP